jgi:hypothetical protein
MLELFVKIMTAEFGRFHRYREPLPPASGLTVEKSKCYFFSFGDEHYWHILCSDNVLS